MIEAEKMEVRPEVVSIERRIEDVSNIYSSNASSKNLQILHSTDPRISPALLVDPLRLRQILNNFVSNALTLTAHGSIEIRAELRGCAGPSHFARGARLTALSILSQYPRANSTRSAIGSPRRNRRTVSATIPEAERASVSAATCG